MRQRVKLAQAMVHDPPLCLLDEPTSGLDPEGREEMLGLVAALSRLGGRNFVLSTHLLPDTEGLVDQVLLLNEGKLLAAGPVTRLLSDRTRKRSCASLGTSPDSSPLFHDVVSKRDPKTRNSVSVLPSGDTRPVFEAAHETRTQVRYPAPPSGPSRTCS